MTNRFKTVLGVSLIFVTILMSGCGTSTPKHANDDGTSKTQATTPVTKTSGGIADAIAKPAADNYSFEAVVTDNDKTTPGYKMWVKGKLTRIDTGDGTNEVSMYLDGEKNEAYSYVKSQNIAMKQAYKRDPGQSDPYAYASSIDKNTMSQYVNKGSETIDGIKCTAYAYEANGITAKIYISDEYGVVIKYQGIQNGKVTQEVYYKNFKIGSVTDNDVTLPKGVKIMDVGNIQGSMPKVP